MSGPPIVIDRRRVLAGAGLFALVALTSSACGSAPTPPEIVELEAQRKQAHRDSDQAAAAGAALPASSTLGPALTQVARERAEHARALQAEIARATGRVTAEAGGTSTAAPDVPTPTVPDVVNALRSAADSAGKLAVTSTGYRAGLLASVSAACTAAWTVSLAVQS